MYHTRSTKAAFWESEKYAYKAQTVNDPLCRTRVVLTKTPILLEGDSATTRNFGQNDRNRSRNGKSEVEAQ